MSDADSLSVDELLVLLAGHLGALVPVASVAAMRAAVERLLANATAWTELSAMEEHRRVSVAAGLRPTRTRKRSDDRTPH